MFSYQAEKIGSFGVGKNYNRTPEISSRDVAGAAGLMLGCAEIKNVARKAPPIEP